MAVRRSSRPPKPANDVTVKPPAKRRAPGAGRRIDAARRGHAEVPRHLLRYYGTPAIDLSHNELREIPPWIGRFTALRELDLAGNLLTELSAEIARLKELEVLRLGFNAFKTVPACIATLPKLRVLDLWNFAGDELPEWIGDLSSLEELRLDSGAGDWPRLHVPASIGRLTKLRKLEIVAFTMALPASLGRLRALEHLVIGESPQTRIPASVGRLRRLKHLGMNGQRTVPPWLHRMPFLRTLEIRGDHWRPHEREALQRSLPDCVITFDW